MRPIWFGLTCLAWLCLATAVEAIAASELPVPIDASRSVPVVGTQTFTVLQDVPINWTVAQVAAEPSSRFSFFNPLKTYPLSFDKTFWLHFRVAATDRSSSSSLIFEFPKPFVNQVDFYYKDIQGQWRVQTSGKLKARTQWALRGLYPRFELPSAGATVQDIYVRVSQYVPIRIQPDIKTLNDSNDEMQKKLFTYGLVLGLLLLMGLFSLLLALSYRRSIYAWYSLYAVFAAVTVASYTGVGNHLLWPNSTWWAQISLMTCVLVAMSLQVQFCRVMFLHELVARWVNWAALASLFVSLLCIAGLLTLPLDAIGIRVNLFFIGLANSAVMLVVLVVFLTVKRSTIGWLWILAFSPLVILISITAPEAMGAISFPDLPYDAVVYAATFEAMVLIIAMQMHVKGAYRQKVVLATKDEMDPLTGFLAPQQFEPCLNALWAQAKKGRSDLVIVYVQVSLSPRHGTTGEPFNDEHSIRRVVKILHTVSREADTVVLVAGNVFAILMPGVSPGENLKNKLSRLVALGLMPDRDDPKAVPIYFRVAVASKRSIFVSPQLLVQLMFKTLQDKNLWQDRSIRMLKN